MVAPIPEKGRRLGRGLDFLLSPADSPKLSTEQIEIEIEKVRSNPWQPRSAFDEDSLVALAESIRQHGVIQPIAVRRRGESFELIAGERRLLAAKRVGLSRIPAVVRSLDDSQMLMVALVENVQRADLNPVDRALALKRLTRELGKSHDEIAAMAGLARSTVTNSIRLLELDESSLEALRSARISEGHARALLGVLDVERRRAVLQQVIDKQLNVRQTEVETSLSSRSARRRPSVATEDAKRLAQVLSETLGARVRILERGVRGRIVVDYATLKDFERIFVRLTGRPPPVE